MPEEDQKPFADVGTRRHSEDDKRHGMHGKSCKKVSEYAFQRLTEEHVDRTTMPSARPLKSVQWTAFEVDGERDCMHSLRDAHAWDEVPALLAQHTITAPKLQKSSDGTLTTSFQLEPVIEQIFDDRKNSIDGRGARAKRQPATDGKLYQLRPGSKRPVLFAAPPTETPSGVGGKLLQPVRIGDARTAFRMPLVRKDHTSCAWDVLQHGGAGTAQLEIDLGGDCLLTHISTQGRQPPTRQYPSVQRERRAWRCLADLPRQHYSATIAGLGRRAKRSALEARQQSLAEDAATGDYYSVEGRPKWNLLTHGQYEGPFWEVLSLKADEERCRQTGRAYTPGERWLQWVKRYAVHARVDGGRSWVSLGIFKGNSNATDEVAHDVRGLRARYLRITPLEVEGGGALRVGLYGLGAVALARGERLATHGDASAAKEPPEPITYTLRTAPPSLNTKYTHCERHTHRGKMYGWECVPKSSKRAARRMQAWAEEANGAEEADWAAEWAEAELMADAIDESKAQAEAQAAAEAEAAEKIDTFAMIANCDREFAASFVSAHGEDLDRAVHAFFEPTGEQALADAGGRWQALGETDGLSEASSRLLRSISTCGSEMSSEAVAVDLADVASEWSELADSEELASLPSDWEDGGMPGQR